MHYLHVPYFSFNAFLLTTMLACQSAFMGCCRIQWQWWRLCTSICCPPHFTWKKNIAAVIYCHRQTVFSNCGCSTLVADVSPALVHKAFPVLELQKRSLSLDRCKHRQKQCCTIFAVWLWDGRRRNRCGASVPVQIGTVSMEFVPSVWK